MGGHLRRTMDVDEESWHVLIQSMLFAGGLAMCGTDQPLDRATGADHQPVLDLTGTARPRLWGD